MAQIPFSNALNALNAGGFSNPSNSTSGSRSQGSNTVGSRSRGSTSTGSTFLEFGASDSSGLLSFSGKEVRINRGGPDSITGRLVKVQNDHIVVQVKGTEEIMYINTSHIKSITSSGNTSGSYKSMPPYVSAPDFTSLLGMFTHKFVQINKDGPEKVEGFVVNVSNQYLYLVSNRETLKIAVFHIKSIKETDSQKSSGGKSSDNTSGGKSSGQKSSNGKNANSKSGGKGSNKSRNKNTRNK
ncbi:DUF2642 domain-containing protein [Ferviditalea candida]|uniref:DUF2642 domain-containing protein n=1 Tax=Ferviditalea candida TaxID=3108399 RepID=A0ABU5ZC57_9BACL|nr:DUF2642 domain-containing protein [Paenibacillaceae bacterium T2]